MRALRWLAIGIGVMVVLAFLAWRSGDRAAVDEVALAEARTGVELESRRVGLGDLSLHVVFAGPPEGAPVVLLHGFPEFWFSWHEHLGHLARAGFRAIAPDLRGYNRSDKPADPQAYGPQYGDDVIRLLDVLGIEDAFLAGHDVGAGVTWRLVYEHPQRVRRAVILNGVHPIVWTQANPADDEEAISWFRSFFRLSWLPELVARAGGWWLLSKNLRDTSRPGTFDDETLAVYQAAWDRDGAISSMIHAYRHDWPKGGATHMDAPAPVPVRLVFGVRDAFIPPAAMRLSGRYAGEGAVREIPDATHWVLLEEPELTSRMLIQFFEAHPGA